MKITSTKIYAKDSKVSSLCDLKECLLQKVDVTIEGIETSTDFIEILSHIQGWGYEMGIELSIENGAPSCTFGQKSEETCQTEKNVEISDRRKKGRWTLTNGEKENIYRSVKAHVLYRSSSKDPIPVSWIVYLIRELNPRILDDMDGLYEVFFDLITNLQKASYTFLWDENCTYYIFQALCEKYNKEQHHDTRL